MDKENSAKRNSIKCVVWDLDNTLWDGILLEDACVALRPGVRDIIATLDTRGILHSIASKNDYEKAMAKLEELGIREFFLVPQINWNAKSTSLQHIASLLNIGIDSIAFVDDQAFERGEVAFTHPTILCIDANDIDEMLLMPEMMPTVITEDTKRRRLMYLSEFRRKEAEEAFSGPSEEFLSTLEMVMSIKVAEEDDLERAEELTIRTHQLNTTGYTYSYEELNVFRLSPHHLLFIVEFEDKYGPYGKVGLALIECYKDRWVLKLLLMSCRVMSRGLGTIFLNYIIGESKKACVRLQAEFVANDRNRMMLITYKLGGFQQVKQEGAYILFEHDGVTQQPVPSAIRLIFSELPSLVPSNAPAF